MTNSIPPEPQSSRRKTLGFREFVGVFVAFSTIGTILFWSLTQQDEGFNLPILSSPASPDPTPVPTPPPAVSPAPPPPARVGPGTVGPGTVGPEKVGSGKAGPATVGPQIVGARGPAGFSDVPEGYWALPFISALAERGVVGGFADGTFRPDRPVTRAEYAAMLQRAFDQPPSQDIETYKDIPSNFWAAPAIQEATRTEFLSGYPAGDFRPDQQIPRVQALVALVSGLRLSAQSSPNQLLQTYQDAEQIPKWAPGQVAAATQAGFVVNYPDQSVLNPNQSATRAEVAAFIHQALVQAGQADRIDSQYIVQP